jgi:hypothetical protein
MFVKCACIAAALAALHITGSPSLEGHPWYRTCIAIQRACCTSDVKQLILHQSLPCVSCCSCENAQEIKTSSSIVSDTARPDVYAAGYTRRKTSLRT